MRRAFTSVEVLTTIAILAVLAGMSVPFWRNFLIRNDLYLAVEQTEQMLRRAQILAQSGDTGPWGFYVPDGVLYQGDSFGNRDVSRDEILEIPPSISISGTQDVSFSAVYGTPSTLGTITFEAINGETAEIIVRNTSFGEPVADVEMPNASFRVTFTRIKNTGQGNAEPTVQTGFHGEEYAENVSIPLYDELGLIIDGGIDNGADGVAVERANGFLRIRRIGGLPLFQGQEIVDVRITLQNATITGIENESWPNSTEFPFDGYAFDWPIGDEITQESSTEVFYQSRVTNESDGFILHWKTDEDRSGW